MVFKEKYPYHTGSVLIMFTYHICIYKFNATHTDKFI